MYIVNYNKQVALIKEMKQLRKDEKKYEVYYHHPYTNQMWKSFFPCASGNKLGPKLLRHEPVPADINKRLSICLAEDAPENAVGLGIEWSARLELWTDIFQALENNYSHYNRKQLKLFLDNLHLDKAKENIPVNKTKENMYEKDISEELVGKLIWRSRKIRMKRFFVLG